MCEKIIIITTVWQWVQLITKTCWLLVPAKSPADGDMQHRVDCFCSGEPKKTLKFGTQASYVAYIFLLLLKICVSVHRRDILGMSIMGMAVITSVLFKAHDKMYGTHVNVGCLFGDECNVLSACGIQPDLFIVSPCLSNALALCLILGVK